MGLAVEGKMGVLSLLAMEWEMGVLSVGRYR
jgi:hypothetical protein